MAAVHSLETQGQQCVRGEELEEPGGMTEKCEPESTFPQLGAKEDAVMPDDSSPTREECIGGDGVAVEQTEPSAMSKAGGGDDVANKEHSVVDLSSADEMPNHSHTPSNERHFDWSDTEEDAGNAQDPPKDDENNAHMDDEEDKASETQAISNAEEDTREETPLPGDERSPVRSPCVEVELEPDEDNEGEGKEDHDEDNTVKHRSSRLVCKECGKRFTRQEMLDLHLHTHSHKDDLATLTCKECGLSFKHRSSLIKHRSGHREKEEEVQAMIQQRERLFRHREKEEQAMMNQQREETPFRRREKEAARHPLEKEAVRVVKYPLPLRYQCEYCRHTFSKLSKLKRHPCTNPDKPLRWVRNSDSGEKPYRCPLCRKEFLYKWCMTKHIQSHSLGVLFHCQECNKGFADGVALRVHQRCHSALKPYECPDCGMVFKHHSVMEDHRRRHTQPTRLHQCHICNKTFKYSSLLHQHQYLHTGQKPFCCLDCGKTFAFAQNLKAHCRQHKLRPYACHICRASFPDPERLQAHMVSHTTPGGLGKENSNKRLEFGHIFKCPLCPETFSSPPELRAHMLIHEAEYERLEHGSGKVTSRCPHCPLTFSDQISLRSHISRRHEHLTPPANEESVQKDPPINRAAPLSAPSVLARWRGDETSTRWKREDMSSKPLKCPDCGKSFRHRSVLELHMRIHSKTKPYQCKICQKSFRFNNYLQQHLIIHTGEKPFKCADCGKGFAFLQNMKTHQKLHQQKPFRCTQCRKGYSDETQLQRHIMSHTGDKPYKCTVCNKSFGIAYLLRDHMNTHTGERPHHCQECHKSFTWVSSLLVHRKVHAQKHLLQSQALSSPKGMRITGSRGRRGGGRMSWPRVSGSGSAPPLSQHFPPLQWEARTNPSHPARHVPGPSRSSQMDLHFSDSDSESRRQPQQWPSEDPAPAPVQWQVEGGQLRPVQQQQQQQHRPAPPQMVSGSPSQPPAPPRQQQQRVGPGWVVQSPSSLQHVPTSAQQSLEPRPLTTYSTKVFPAGVPKNTSVRIDLEQHRPQSTLSWANIPTSMAMSSAQLSFPPAPPTYIDSTALWGGVRTAPAVQSSQSPTMKFSHESPLPIWSSIPMSSQSPVMGESVPKKVETRVWNLGAPQNHPQTVKQLEMPWNGREQQKQWSPGMVSVQMGQNNGISNVPTLTHETLGMPKTLTPPEKSNISQELLLQQQQQLPPGWSPATHKVPITIQYDPRRFAHAPQTTFWGIQPTPVGPQTLITGPIKHMNGQEMQQQQQPMMGTQIIINQTPPYLPPPLTPFPPFALPGSHPLHSVGSMPRPPNPNFFFTPQAIMSERPPMQQVMSPGMPQVMSQGMPQVMSQGMPQVMSQGMPQVMSQGMPQVMSQGMPQVMSQAMPQVMSQAMPQVMSQAMPQVMTSQAMPQVMSQTMSQTMSQAIPLPQRSPRTEPHKSHGGHLPFAPDRLLQCMICGMSLPREMDLQMHYMQHAQGEI